MGFSHDILSCLRNLITSEDELYCDFSVEVEDEVFHCHRFILGACSSFFRALFHSDMQETKQKTVRLKEISCDSFKLIYGILYLKENNLNKDNFLDVWKAAHFLQIDFIVSACQKMALTTINERNCHRYLWHAKFLDKKVMARIMEHITRSFDQFRDSECVMELEGYELMSIVRDPNLKTSREENVAEAVLKWVNYSPSEDKCLSENDFSETVNEQSKAESCHATNVKDDNLRSKFLVPLLSMSRLSSLSAHYLNKLFHHRLIVGSSGARDLIFKVSMYMSGYRPNYWPPFACHRRCSRWEDVVLLPTGMNSIDVFNMMEQKSSGRLDSSDLPPNAVLSFHREQLYACSYTPSHGNLLSMFVQESHKWRNVTNLGLSDNVSQQGAAPQAGGRTLWTFIIGEDVIVVHAHMRRIFQWDPAMRNDIKLLTSVPTESSIVYVTPYESSILVICGSPNDSGTLNVYDTSRQEWEETVTLDGLCINGISSFYKDDKLYILSSDGKLYVVTRVRGGFTLKYKTTISNLSFPLIGAQVYFEDLFLFVEESTLITVWDPYPKSLLLQQMFNKVHVIVSRDPCTCLVPALMPRRV